MSADESVTAVAGGNLERRWSLPRVGEVLRTPESRFAGIPDFPYPPHWTEVGGLRIAHVEAGPANADPVLLMHGEPTWSFLYRKMIPPLVASGHRVIAPDLVGFGRSDKPASPRDYSYAMPKKARRNAIKSVLSEKIRNDRLFILDELKLTSKKTRDTIKTLSHFNFDKLLIVDQKDNSDLMLSTRNIPHIKAIDVGEMNVYDSLNYNYIMLSVDVVKKLMEVLK